MLVRLNGVCCEKQFLSITKTFLLHLEWWSEINIIVAVIVILVKKWLVMVLSLQICIFYMKMKNNFVFFKLTVLLKQFLLNFFKLFGCKISIFKRLRCENNVLRKNATSWYKNSKPKKEIMWILYESMYLPKNTLLNIGFLKIINISAYQIKKMSAYPKK